MTNTAQLTGVLADHIEAVNAFDAAAIVATFAEDALVNDNHREFWGTSAIRAWVEKEMVGDHVTLEVIEVIEHHGDTYVRAHYDGDYDKAGLPDPLIMTHYFSVREDKIVRLYVIRNRD
jgi:ketosteroid isomerase-like protein